MEGAINDQIKESNVALDKTQSMTDANVSSVSSRTHQITELRSRSWWTIFRDLKYLIIALVLFFICIPLISLLPKAK